MGLPDRQRTRFHPYRVNIRDVNSVKLINQFIILGNELPTNNTAGPKTGRSASSLSPVETKSTKQETLTLELIAIYAT